jgi:hypothetical protein
MVASCLNISALNKKDYIILKCQVMNKRNESSHCVFFLMHLHVLCTVVSLSVLLSLSLSLAL